MVLKQVRFDLISFFALQQLMPDVENFIKRIVIEDNFNPEFYFSQINTLNGIRYYISVLDKDRRSYFFNMEQQNGCWKITNYPKAPDWVMKVEVELESAIFESMVGQNPVSS